MKKLRLRILVTDGQRVADLFWLTHKEKDIYYGRPAIRDIHSSYHGSGKRHIEHLNGSKDKIQSIPLADFKGHCDLVQIGFGAGVLNSRAHRYSGKSSEAVAYIDVRSLPKQKNYIARIGLMEPNAFTCLPLDLPHIQVCQVLIVPVLVPWVYVITGVDVPLSSIR